MGSSTSRPLTPLSPVYPPIGLNTSYCSSHPVILVFQHSSSSSGDDLTIRDFASGLDIVKCEKKLHSFIGEKVITDPTGQVLFAIKNILKTRSTTIHARDPFDQLIFTILSKSSYRLGAHIINASDGCLVELNLPRNIFRDPAEIEFKGRPVAQISRYLPGAKKSSARPDTFFVSVASGVDVALIAAIVVCLDEITAAERRSHTQIYHSHTNNSNRLMQNMQNMQNMQTIQNMQTVQTVQSTSCGPSSGGCC